MPDPRPNTGVPPGVARTEEVVQAALACLHAETMHAADRHAGGAEMSKRRLAKAVLDYLDLHWDGYIPQGYPFPEVTRVARMVRRTPIRSGQQSA